MLLLSALLSPARGKGLVEVRLLERLFVFALLYHKLRAYALHGFSINIF
jgi:hypothetical protein